MNQTFNQKLGSILREKRNEKGYSQEYVASHIGVTKNMVSHWELGKRSIYAEHLESFCKILGITMQETFDEMNKIGG